MFGNYRFGSVVNGENKIKSDKVAYTVVETVIYRNPRVPHPRFDWTKTALEFNFICITEIIA